MSDRSLTTPPTDPWRFQTDSGDFIPTAGPGNGPASQAPMGGGYVEAITGGPDGDDQWRQGGRSVYPPDNPPTAPPETGGGAPIAPDPVNR